MKDNNTLGGPRKGSKKAAPERRALLEPQRLGQEPTTNPATDGNAWTTGAMADLFLAIGKEKEQIADVGPSGT